MRFAYVLTSAALTLAGAPALAQTTTAPQTAPSATTTVGQTTTTTTTTGPAGMVGSATTAAPVPIGPSVGATVYGVAGTPVGTIKAMDAKFVTLATEQGEVKLPIAGVGPGLKGPVIGLTAEQLAAAVAQANAARAPTATATTTTTTRTTTTKKVARKKGRR